MKYIVFFAFGLILSSLGEAQAMGSSPPAPDPECFASDTLRVEIGGEKFAFPREIVHSIRGEDVVNSRGEKWNGNANALNACQKYDDDYWRAEQLLLHITLKPCHSKQECSLHRISVTITPFIDEALFQRSPFPKTKDELLASCRPPNNETIEWIKTYWRNCKYAFHNDHIYAYMKFTGGGGVYPPENIEGTKASVLREIYKHRIEVKE